MYSSPVIGRGVKCPIISTFTKGKWGRPSMSDIQYYRNPGERLRHRLSIWDILVFVIVSSCLAAFVLGAQSMTTPYEIGDAITISLDSKNLFSYSVSSVMRMGIALFFSFLFTFTIGTLAAKNRRAEKVIIPLVDVMQSIPILGFQSVSILSFIYLFPGSLLGPECAAIFAIFTSQAWNMILSFYQSLRSLPKDLRETAAIFHLNAWQKFWRIEVPYATPSLLWNTMMSLSAGWFFVVASEAISVSNQDISLPGIGSYIHLALTKKDNHALMLAIVVMLLIIMLYDQLIFRPLLAWADKFKPNQLAFEDASHDPWFLILLQRSTFSGWVNQGLSLIKNRIVNFKLPSLKLRPLPPPIQQAIQTTGVWSWNLTVVGTIIWGSGFTAYFIYHHLTLMEVLQVVGYGFITLIKVAAMIILASLIWIPIGTWIGLNQRLSRIMQPLVQCCAAFPADVVYPVIMMAIIHFQLDVNWWSTPLMILGTQWYILFNVIAGTQSLPDDLKQVAKNYGVKGWLWWKRLIFPGIFPYYLTGAITAAGGCWNASILADVIRWGDTTVYAVGLGSYINIATTRGDFPRIALGIGVMCLFVIIVNRLLWHRLYALARSRYSVGDQLND